MGQREDRALVFLMAACVIIFFAQLPRLSREAHLTGRELNVLLGGAMFAWVFIAPLLLYFLAGLSHIVARIVGGRGSFYGARLALFWSLLASTPLVLFHGLVAGFIGQGAGLQAVGIIWVAIFGWFWVASLLHIERHSQ